MLLKNWLFRNKLLPKNPPALMSGRVLHALMLCCVALCSSSQINLVRNHSFENISSCPTTPNKLKLAIGWDTLKNGGGGTPELYSNCSNNSNVGVPKSMFSFQYPKSGNNFSGIGLYAFSPISSREYIQNKLSVKLTANRIYCAMFYVNLSNVSSVAIDRIGMYFDNGSVNTTNYGVINLIPQIQSTNGIFYGDTLGWTKIQGMFIANGTEEYLTIGNFNSDALTNTIPISSGPNQAYYNIDDVSVIDAGTKAYAGNDTLICEGDSIFIGREPEIGLECQWFLNNQLIGSGAGMWVKPSKDEQYSVKQDLCGFITYDTIKVSLKEGACYTLESAIFPTVFTPNGDGSNEVWYVNINPAMSVNEFSIYNRWGNLITNSKGHNVIRWDGRTTAGEPCSEGVYFYILNYTDAKGETRHKKGCITLFR